VVVTAPAALAKMTETGSPAALPELIGLLKDPGRAWAAQVLLAALTGREEKFVDVYQGQPGQWYEVLGKTAYERWSKWFQEAKNRLEWSAADRMFIEQRER